jgi:PLP dependent protein
VVLCFCSLLTKHLRGTFPSTVTVTAYSYNQLQNPRYTSQLTHLGRLHSFHHFRYQSYSKGFIILSRYASFQHLWTYRDSDTHRSHNNNNNYHHTTILRVQNIRREMSTDVTTTDVTTTENNESNNDTVDATEMEMVGVRYREVLDRVQAVATTIPVDEEGSTTNQDSSTGRPTVQLVAVSKTKPLALLQGAYNAGCRHFGENYVQELVEKVTQWQDRSDIQWHFIGALQSNKCQTLVNCGCSVSQLTVETISSIKLATKLNSALSNKLIKEEDGTSPRLKVFVQVNTSGEDSKSGVTPDDSCLELCRYIITECPHLEFRGLMTIGAPGDTSCFTTLLQCRDDVRSDLHQNNIVDSCSGVQVPTIELSMGMSDDFENAIRAGSTNVRVGSTIFGHRNYSA